MKFISRAVRGICETVIIIFVVVAWFCTDDEKDYGDY